MFEDCESLTAFRVPSTVKTIGQGVFSRCASLLSLELPRNLETIGSNSFEYCRSLKIIAFPSPYACDTDVDVLRECTDIRKVLHDVDEDYDYSDGIRDEHQDNRATRNVLSKRFGGHLPLHELCYFQAYHNTSAILEDIRRATRDERVDVFGMTPFHILALSPQPNFFLFATLAQQYSKGYL